MGACYAASMCLHARNTADCTMRTVQVRRALSCGNDCLDTMNTETRMDIGAEILHANTGVLAHTDDETRVMINLFEIG